jgi:hypothetical protein
MTYWERQERPDSCRMHAVNACLGKRTYTWPTFLHMCDQFDTVVGLRNTARTEYCAGNGITLFAHALKVAGVDWETLPLAMYRAGSTDDKKTPARLQMAKETASGAFVYNAGHVWYVKRVGNNSWMKLDSLSGATPTSLDAIWHDGLGVELIFQKPLVNAEHSTFSSPIVTPTAVQFPSPFSDIRVLPLAPPPLFSDIQVQFPHPSTSTRVQFPPPFSDIRVRPSIRVLPPTPPPQRRLALLPRQLPRKPSFLGFTKRR